MALWMMCPLRLSPLSIIGLRNSESWEGRCLDVGKQMAKSRPPGYSDSQFCAQYFSIGVRSPWRSVEVKQDATGLSLLCGLLAWRHSTELKLQFAIFPLGGSIYKKTRLIKKLCSYQTMKEREMGWTCVYCINVKQVSHIRWAASSQAACFKECFHQT